MSDFAVLRVVRPYASERDLLQQEAWTVTKKSIFLIGVSQRPEGERVRCELALESGEQLLVAEGVVAKYMEATGNRPLGLVVRFRRMSSASSQFVTRALSARDNEASSPSSAEAASMPVASTAVDHAVPEPSALHSVPLEHQLEPSVGPVVQPRSSGAINALLRLSGRHIRGLPDVEDRGAVLKRLRTRGTD